MTGIPVKRCKRRRRGAFVVNSLGEIELRVPWRTTERRVQEILRTHGEIIEQLRLRAEKNPPPEALELVEGALLPFLGRDYPLRFTARLRTFDQAFMVPRGDSAKVKRAVESLYRELAAGEMTRRAAHFAAQLDCREFTVKIGGARTRWGSCSASGAITFSWRLLCCPPELVDYVAAHEAAHLVELNHSRRFWERVAELCPEFAVRRRQLREYEKTHRLWN